MQVLAHLHGNGDINHPKVLAQYREIQEALQLEQEQSHTSYQELTKPRILKRVILGMSVQMWSQLCGMNVMMYYIVYIMQSTGAGSPLLTASIQYILNTALTLPAILYLDKVGRRPALLVGFFCQAIFLYIEGGLQAGYGKPNPGTDPKLDAISWTVADHPAVGKAIIAMSYLFVCSFATTIGPTSWTYPAEIYPAKVRAKAVSLSTACNWTWNCLLALFVPPLLWSINWKMYMIVSLFPILPLGPSLTKYHLVRCLQHRRIYPHVPYCPRNEGIHPRRDGRGVRQWHSRLAQTQEDQSSR